MRVDVDIPDGLLSEPQREAVESEDPYLLLAGGFGSGKSTALYIKLLALKMRNGRAPGLALGATMGELHSNVIQPMFRMLADSGAERLIPAIVGPTPREPSQHLLWYDGARTWLGSAKSPEGWTGKSVGYLVMDEGRLFQPKLWDLAAARLREPCPCPQIVIGSTPAMGWLSREFNSGNPRRRLITMPTRLNAHNLREGYIEDLEQSYSTRMAAAYIDGEFVMLEGAVYEKLDARDPWNGRWAIDYKYDPGKLTLLWIDPGFRKSAWVFAQEFRPGRLVIFDQLMIDETSDWAAVQAVNAKKYAIDGITYDPASEGTQSALNLSTVAMLKQIKTRSRDPLLPIGGVLRDISFGVDKVRAMFGDPDNGIEPRLFFAKSLQAYESQRGMVRGVMKDHLALSYPEAKHGKPLSNKPVKDGVTDHSTDCTRYGIVRFMVDRGVLLDDVTRKRLQHDPMPRTA